MNTLVYTLGIKPFDPPRGKVTSHQIDEQSIPKLIKCPEQAVYELVLDGCETDLEIAAELSRSCNGIRIYLDKLVRKELIFRFDMKLSKSRYFDSKTNPAEIINKLRVKLKKEKPSVSEKKDTETRLKYIGLINAGVNTSIAIANYCNEEAGTTVTTAAKVTTTLCKMRNESLVNNAQKINGGKTGRQMNVWEVV
jgi:hypothetical protein